MVAPNIYTTASGHPTGGPYALGALNIDETGSLWVCTVAGAPGTWVQIGGGTGSANPVSGQYLCAPTSYAPASQTSLTATSATLAAWSSANVNTGSFTAPPSGSVVVTVTANMQISASAKIMVALAAHGTVTPVVGTTITWNDTATTPRQYCFQFLVTGLTAGTSYNFDLLGACTATDTATILAQGLTSVSIGTGGSPVVMIVQAV